MSQHITKEEIYERIANEDSYFIVKDKPIVSFGIWYNGQRIRMYSGKVAWSGVGPAKNALRNFLETLGGCYNPNVDDIMENDVGPEGTGKTFEIREL